MASFPAQSICVALFTFSDLDDQEEQDFERTLASLDLRTLKVPRGLTLESFRYWIHLSLQASPFMDLVRYFGNHTDTVVGDSVADEWGVSRSIAARWVSTAHNWLKYFDLGG